MSKKKWEKPKLIVLVASKSQEVVLQACKGGIGGGPSSSEGGCEKGFPVCSSCSSMSDS